MPKLLANHAPQIKVCSSTVNQPIITAPTAITTQELPPISHELHIPSTSAPREAIQQVLPEICKRT